ncbi:GreA/GreB family elongation factor [Photorhabdus antumapuensis]|uniref:GreA/GreB family elongation factor n=1 Tax=Photorhabdus antumapuensis TaxID=2862867 RepID=UPI0037C711A7
MPDEFNPANKWISIDFPVARALIGRLVDGKITVEIRYLTVNYCVLIVSNKLLN